MYKVTVMYPTTEGARFDHAYYRDRHMPMVKETLGDAVVRYTVDKGLAGGAPGAPPAFVASCALYVESLEAFQSGMAKHGKAIMADVANYTTIAPRIEISEIVVG